MLEKLSDHPGMALWSPHLQLFTVHLDLNAGIERSV
jgi:hypothetical protein